MSKSKIYNGNPREWPPGTYRSTSEILIVVDNQQEVLVFWPGEFDPQPYNGCFLFKDGYTKVDNG